MVDDADIRQARSRTQRAKEQGSNLRNSMRNAFHNVVQRNSRLRPVRQSGGMGDTTVISGGGGGGGGIDTIEAATDTAILNPQDGDRLVFNGARNIWENRPHVPVNPFTARLHIGQTIATRPTNLNAAFGAEDGSFGINIIGTERTRGTEMLVWLKYTRIDWRSSRFSLYDLRRTTVGIPLEGGPMSKIRIRFGSPPALASFSGEGRTGRLVGSVSDQFTRRPGFWIVVDDVVINIGFDSTLSIGAINTGGSMPFLPDLPVLRQSANPTVEELDNYFGSAEGSIGYVHRTPATGRDVFLKADGYWWHESS